MYLAGFRFARIEWPVGAYRQHELQVTAAASRDVAANAARSEEQAAVKAKYAKSRLTMRLVSAYVTFQQRRVKALAAWRCGGPIGFWSEYRRWVGRKRERRSADGGSGLQ